MCDNATVSVCSDHSKLVSADVAGLWYYRVYKFVQSLVIIQFQHGDIAEAMILHLSLKSSIVLSSPTPTTEVHLEVVQSAQENRMCHVEIVFTHQWWEMGLYWATWGLPYSGVRAINSLLERYTIQEIEYQRTRQIVKV